VARRDASSMDYEQLKGLLSAQPDEAEQRMAKMQGLLGLGIGLLSGSRGNYGAFAPALAQGLQGGMQGFMGAQQMGQQNRDRQLQRGMQMTGLQSQMEQRQLAMQEAQRRQKMLEERRSILGQLGAPPSVAFNPGMAPPGMDIDGARRRLLALDDIDGIKAIDAVYPTTMERFADAVDPQTGRPVTRIRPVTRGQTVEEARYVPDELKALPVAGQPGVTQYNYVNPFRSTTTPVGGLNLPVELNQDVQAARRTIAREGAARTNVNVNTATKPMLDEIGKGVGESVNAAFGQAQSAVQTLNNVDQIRNGLGNVIAGPLANQRITLAQIGTALGVTGKDTIEQLTNTRNVIQGLARQELSAAGQMKGQGQITEAERGILKRAESGEIATLTVPEILTLLGALEKTANFRIGIHEQNMERLARDPNAAGVVDYMRLPRSSTAAAATTPPAAPARPGASGAPRRVVDFNDLK